MEHKKSLYELNLLDRFLFNEAMSDPDTMKDVLEIILGHEILLRHPPQTEKEEGISPRYRSIRLDVWADDIEDTIYDTEAQKKNTHNLPKRSRSYQAVVDSRLLEPGNVDFNALNDLVMIMITPFDLFGQGRFMYTFEMRCREDKDLLLQDGAVRIFLNTRGENGDEVSAELIELLHYMETTTDEMAASCSSTRIHLLHERVQKIRSSEEVSIRYMQAWEEKVMVREEGRQEGHQEGLREGHQEGLREGREVLSQLIKFLMDNGREDEIAQVVSDMEYQKKLLEDYSCGSTR